MRRNGSPTSRCCWRSSRSSACSTGPPTRDCLAALRAEPAIPGLTDALVGLREDDWSRAVHRLREARLLSPTDPIDPGALDAHPLVREWFGERLRRTNAAAWTSAHGRLYEHLRDTTKEGDAPSLAALTPLYHAIAHGCRAGRHQEALDDVYWNRICRRGSDGELYSIRWRSWAPTAAISRRSPGFSITPFAAPVAGLTRRTALGCSTRPASRCARRDGCAKRCRRKRAGLEMAESGSWPNAAICSFEPQRNRIAGRRGRRRARDGGTSGGVRRSQRRRISDVSRSRPSTPIGSRRPVSAAPPRACSPTPRRDSASGSPNIPLLYSLPRLSILRSAPRRMRIRRRARSRNARRWRWPTAKQVVLDIAHDTLTLGRAHHGLALAPRRAYRRKSPRGPTPAPRPTSSIRPLTACALREHSISPAACSPAPRSAAPSATFPAAARDLDEVEEIAEPGPMRLFLCDLALERARLALAPAKPSRR